MGDAAKEPRVGQTEDPTRMANVGLVFLSGPASPAYACYDLPYTSYAYLKALFAQKEASCIAERTMVEASHFHSK